MPIPIRRSAMAGAIDRQGGGCVCEPNLCWGCCSLHPSFSSFAFAGAEQAYEFKQNYVKGQTYNVLISEQFDADVLFTYQGRELGHHKIVDALQQKGLVTIVDTQDGVPATQQIRVDKSSGEFFQMTGERPLQEFSKYAGKTIRTQAAGRDTLYTIDGVEAPRVTPDLSDWLSRDTEIYPDRPVRLKDKWDLSKKAGYIRVLGGDQSVVAFGTLKSIKTIHGRPFAEVIVSAAIEGSSLKQIGMHMESQLEGPALVDLQSGRVAKMDLTGQMQCTGTVNVPVNGRGTVQLNALGTGTIEYHQISVAAKPQSTKTDTAATNFRELP